MDSKNPYAGRTVVLVDDQDNKLGLADIWEAHKNPGMLHRAISVVLWRRNGKKIEILLQQRSKKKPLWPMFWSNTVCTHPYDGEGYLECGIRRLREELSIEREMHQLKTLFAMKYQADYTQELSEHELDTIIIGEFDGKWECNPDEAADAGWKEIEAISNEVLQTPEKYTPWFKLLMKNQEFISRLG